MFKETIKKSVKVVIILVVTAILLLAWAPWLTEENGREKVLDYFNKSYGVDKNDIRVGSVEKKPFEIDFGLYLSPSNKSLPETSVSSRVNFYGDVKHEILSAPWFTEENAREKFFEYFREKGFRESSTIIDSIRMTPSEANIAFHSPRPLNNSWGQIFGVVIVTVYGEIKEIELKALS